MKSIRALPIPFLILILAGVVSLFSLVAEPRAKAQAAADETAQVQLVEQERMAMVYFRVLSWFSGVTAPSRTSPAGVNDQSSPTPKVVESSRSPACPGKIELCSLPMAETAKHRRQTLN